MTDPQQGAQATTTAPQDSSDGYWGTPAPMQPTVPATQQALPLTNSGMTAAPSDDSDGYWGTPVKPQSALTLGPSDTFAHRAENVEKMGLGLFSGIGEGVFDTAAGLSELVNKATDPLAHSTLGGLTTPSKDHVIPQFVVDYLHNLAGDNEQASNAEKIGYGGETLAEFIMGDEALKALPMAQRLSQAAKTMKIVEGSPRLLKALKIGSRVLADALETGVRGGAVQGAQTYVRSGGDTQQAISDAGQNAAIGTALSAGLGTVGEVANKFGLVGKAANVINSITDTAKGALSEEGVFSGLGNAIRSSRQIIDNIFQGAGITAKAEGDAALGAKTAADDQAGSVMNRRKTAAETGYEVATQAAQDAHNAQIAAANGTKESQNAAATQKRQADILFAQQSLKLSQEQLHTDLLDRMDQATPGAVAPEDAAELLSNGVHAYKKAASDIYQNGLTGENGLVTHLGALAPSEFIGSESQKAAQTALKAPNPLDHVDKQDLDALAGEELSKGTRQFLEDRASGVKTVKGEGPKGLTDIAAPDVKTPIAPRTIAELVDNAEAARNLESLKPWGSPDQKALHIYREGIIKDIDAMVATSDNPEAVANYRAMAADYRSKMEDLRTSTAQKLRLNKPDKALGDAASWLRKGGNAKGKIETMARVAGPDVMSTVAQTDVQNLRALAESNPDKFVADWTNPLRTPQYLKDSYYGPELSGKLDDAITLFKKGNEYAQQEADDIIAQATHTHLGDTQAATTEHANAVHAAAEEHADQTGSLSIEKGLDDAQATADHTNALQRNQDKYNAALAATQDALDKATETNTTKTAPYKSPLMTALSQGRANAALSNGTLALQDIRAVKEAAGDHWGDIRDGLFQRGMIDSYDAAGKPIAKTPEQVLQWWDGMAPDVRSELFSTNNPASIRAYNDAISDIRDSAAVKTLLKNGVLTATKIATALPGIAVGATVHGDWTPLAELIGGVASAWGGKAAKGFIENLVNKVADNPSTWKTLGKIGKAAEVIEKGAKVTAPQAGKLVKAGQVLANPKDDTRRSVYAGTAGALGGRP